MQAPRVIDFHPQDFALSMVNILSIGKSKKQAVVSRSSAEYHAMAQSTCDLLWLRSHLQELGFPEIEPSTLFYDKKSAIMFASDSILYKRPKHIEVNIHFLRKKGRSRIISPYFVRFPNQTADVFTKSVGPSLLKSSVVKLGFINVFTPA